METATPVAKPEGDSVAAAVPQEEDLKTAPELEVDAQGAADFLELCLGGPAAVLEAEIDFFDAEEDDASNVDNGLESAADSASKAPTEHFGMFSIGDDSGSEEDADGPDLEDMFDFDPACVAELMKKGADLEELAEHLQETYVEALERRLGVDVPKAASLEEPAACENCFMGDLSDLMTPEQVTPLVSPKGAAANEAKEAGDGVLAGAHQVLDDTCRRTQERSRRSLAVQQRPSAAHRGTAVVKAMEAFGRRSLAQLQGEAPEDLELLQGAVQSAVRRASNRHRRSITKAVEVLEEIADGNEEPLEKWSEETMDAKVELIQEAMDEAYKRHRRSIVAAVQGVVDVKADNEKAATVLQNVQNAPQDAVEARIQSAVAAAYQRHVSAATGATQVTEEVTEEWTFEMCPAGEYYKGYTDQWDNQWNSCSWSQHHEYPSTGWDMQHQSSGNSWYSEQQQYQHQQQWSEGYGGGYGAKTASPCAVRPPPGFRPLQAPWRLGSG